MNTRKRWLLVLGGLMLCLGLPWIFIWRQTQNEVLDRALVDAVARADVPAVKVLLDQGANANTLGGEEPPRTLPAPIARFVANWRGESYWESASPIRMPVLQLLMRNLSKGLREERSDAIAVMLIEHGADIITRRDDYQSILQTAAGYGLHKTVGLLIARGADVNERSKLGVTALMFAHDEDAPMLIDHGADVNAASNGFTALMAALDRRHLGTAKAIIERGARVDVINPEGHTALFYALFWNRAGPERAAVVRVLEQRGARLNVKDRAALAKAHLPVL